MAGPLPAGVRAGPAPEPDAGTHVRGHAGGMATPPIVIHRPTPSGARLVTVHIAGREEKLGLAHSDHDVIVFLADAGLADPARALDTPSLVEWQGAAAHEFAAG